MIIEKTECEMVTLSVTAAECLQLARALKQASSEAVQDENLYLYLLTAASALNVAAAASAREAVYV